MFPMTGNEAAKLFRQYLSDYEQEEVKGFETVYFVNTQPKKKIFSHDFPTGGSTPDPESEEANCKLFNGGNDNIHGDYLYETGEVLGYRYEV
jgi:hypothetical protein